MNIGNYTHEEFMDLARSFHGYPAPGLIIGAYMVEMARKALPEGILFDVISESKQCLPDAVQLLTPCTVGNGWLRVYDFGLYAVTLFDKHTGEGFRVHLDVSKMDNFSEIRTWFLKLKPKREQDTPRLQEEIRLAAESILSIKPVTIKPEVLGHSSMGPIGQCPQCGEYHPVNYGSTCRCCQGQGPYVK